MGKQWPFPHYIDACHCNADDYKWNNVSMIYIWWMEFHWYSFIHIKKLSVLNTKIFHVNMLNNEETIPFSHYLVVNQCNVDGFECISKIMMFYVWMDFYLCIIWFYVH